MEYTTTISSKGQITLPIELRRALNVQTGDRLSIVKRGNYIAVTPDTYDEELAELRAVAWQHLQKKGLLNLSIEDIKSRSDAAKKASYENS